MGARAALAGLILFCCLPGCSFTLTTAPPAHALRLPPNARLECTSSRAAPVVDSVLAGLAGLETTVGALADDRDFEGEPFSREVFLGASIGAGALFTVSAIYGFSVTSDCRDAKAMQEFKRGQRDIDGEPPPAEPITYPAPGASP